MTEENGRYEIKREKPYVELKPRTMEVLFSFIDHCIEWEVDQASFELFNTVIYISEYKPYWEIIAKDRWEKTTDIYRIDKPDKELIYQYSERD